MSWFVLLLVASATFWDVRCREIPNWIPACLLCVGGLATACGMTNVTWAGIACGIGIGFVITLPLYAVGAFGGGDLKLVVAMGAALGPLALLSVLAWTALAGGVLALVAWARGRRDLPYVPAIALGLLTYVVRTQVFDHASAF